MKNLGFGMMRLPVLNGNPTDFDYDQLNKMVDAFLNRTPPLSKIAIRTKIPSERAIMPSIFRAFASRIFS